MNWSTIVATTITTKLTIFLSIDNNYKKLSFLILAGSFEELMRLAQDNSKQATFGSSIRKPEDVLREQRKKEAQREREKQQFLVC